MATVQELLRRGAQALAGAGGQIDRPGHEAAILLAAAAGLTKEQLYRRYTDTLPPDTLTTYEEFLSRRTRGTPVAYILGRKEFYGRTFLTDPRALIPRPDTELLVDRALQIIKREIGTSARCEPYRVHDCCTGTGCIPITLAAELAEARLGPVEVSASDISPAALELARENEARLAPGLVTFRKCDLLRGIENAPFDLITANPPYLTSEETAEALSRGWGEPALALDGGPEGFDLIPRLLREALASLRQNGYILVEAASSQAAAVRSLMQEAGFVEIETAEDLAGRERVTIGRYDSDHR
ncbi:MAG: peptide chain release factor N(5)-glutamine methyltransferase [Alkalispirochaetaceae bacterium]